MKKGFCYWGATFLNLSLQFKMTKIKHAWFPVTLSFVLTHSSLSQTNLSLYFEIKGYLGIYNEYYMTISANEFYLRALMMSIRSERSDRMRDITNTRKLLTRPKTTCQSKVSFNLCKKIIKHSSQAKKISRKNALWCVDTFQFSIILSAFSLLIFFRLSHVQIRASLKVNAHHE